MKSPKVTRYFIATPLPAEVGGGYGIVDNPDSGGRQGFADAAEAKAEAERDALSRYAVVQRSERVVFTSEI